jgi:CopG family transcriptional regulator, nickel-responsive regulator
MQRLTISIDDDLARTFDRLVREKGYENRSEAFRDLVRKELGEEQLLKGKAKHCVGTLSYVYNHHERQLAARLTSMQHDHHDMTVSTMHAHLDHENCIETVILRGPTAAVTRFAQDVIAQTGVRHGKFYPIPVDLESGKKSGHAHHHPHA